MWLHLEHPLLETWLATQVCALTGNCPDWQLFSLQARAQFTELRQPGQSKSSLADQIADSDIMKIYILIFLKSLRVLGLFVTAIILP